MQVGVVGKGLPVRGQRRCPFGCCSDGQSRPGWRPEKASVAPEGHDVGDRCRVGWPGCTYRVGGKPAERRFMSEQAMILGRRQPPWSLLQLAAWLGLT